MEAANDYYAAAAVARGFNFSTFIKVAMDEYIERHPVPATVPLDDVLSMCGIDKAELLRTEGIELE